MKETRLTTALDYNKVSVGIATIPGLSEACLGFNPIFRALSTLFGRATISGSRASSRTGSIFIRDGLDP